MNLKEASSSRWSADNPPTIEQIKGSLQRIVDACELMAGNYLKLQGDRDNYLRWYLEEQKLAERLQRSNSSLRGVITKLKKRKAAQNETT